MDSITPIQILILMGAAIASALLVLWLAGLVLSRPARSATQVAPQQDDAFFLFRNDQLVDLDLGSRTDRDTALDQLSRWDALRTRLQAVFPALPERLAELPNGREIRFNAQQEAQGMHLICHREGRNSRLRLQTPQRFTAWDSLVAIAEGQVQFEQVEALRNAPCAICVTDAAGRNAWHNTAWASLPERVTEQALSGPSDDDITRVKDPDAGRCFEILTARQVAGHALYVTEVTGLVRAENAQRKFVQTLTKTFANLTTGLAVFDRNQELALFNPALLDLTALPAAFLTARPHVMSFFDGLRDRQVMPEPRSYAKWRDHILDMIESASDGLYQENWALPSGLTYRITGRPHPDGAVAFLIEDITDEMSIKRRFRAQLDLRQLVMDGLDEAITVFDSRNLLMFCNKRCADFLGIDPDSSFADFSVADIIRAYKDTPSGDADWTAVEETLTLAQSAVDERWTLNSRTGDCLECRVQSLSGGTKVLLVRRLAAAVEGQPTAAHA
jgi:PAS domain-containing protein